VPAAATPPASKGEVVAPTSRGTSPSLVSGEGRRGGAEASMEEALPPPLLLPSVWPATAPKYRGLLARMDRRPNAAPGPTVYGRAALGEVTVAVPARTTVRAGGSPGETITPPAGMVATSADSARKLAASVDSREKGRKDRSQAASGVGSVSPSMERANRESVGGWRGEEEEEEGGDDAGGGVGAGVCSSLPSSLPVAGRGIGTRRPRG